MYIGKISLSKEMNGIKYKTKKSGFSGGKEYDYRRF